LFPEARWRTLREGQQGEPAIQPFGVRLWRRPPLVGSRTIWRPILLAPDVAQSNTVAAISQIFLSGGYELTNNREVEPGYEKVAIYVSLEDAEFSHIAKSDGHVWKSKLGKGRDIEHYSLDVLEGDQGGEYGIVDRILRRRL
jgi:hypothetical protein